jgi:hypothetical protein
MKRSMTPLRDGSGGAAMMPSSVISGLAVMNDPSSIQSRHGWA